MMSPLGARLALLCSLAALVVACGGDDEKGGGLAGGTGASGGTGATGTGGSSPIPVTGGSSGTSGSSGSSGKGGNGQYMLPDGYTRANDKGGWLVGDPVVKGEDPPDFGVAGTMGCGQEILGIVRDFKNGKQDGHPDFETFNGSGQKGIVLDELGDDDKPVYNDDAPRTFSSGACVTDPPPDDGARVACTTTEDNFDQWYNDDPAVNRPYYTFFSLEPNNGIATFHSSEFFPLDDLGFGDEGSSHNFLFTTEVHTTFRYEGGERFAFTGDDDVWVFINKHLAIDLGGLHSEQSASVDLDDVANEFDLTKGEIYPLDLFHAERHTNQSNFRIDTSLYFVDCGVIVPSEPVK